MDLFVLAVGQNMARGEMERRLKAAVDDLYSTYCGASGPVASAADLTGAALVTARSRAPGSEGLTVWHDQRFLLVVYGDHGGIDGIDPLAICHRGKTEDLITATLTAAGGFGAMLWDREMETVRLWCDITGQFALRFARAPCGTLHISSHDIGLILSGGVRPVADPLSSTLVLGTQSAIGRNTLLADVAVSRPYDCTLLSTGKSNLQPRLQPVVEPSAPDEPVRDLILSDFASRISGHGPIRVELTAGMDSRAALAFTAAVAEASDIETFCDGRPDDPDAMIASAISAKCGYRFERVETAPPTIDALQLHWARSSIATNGFNDLSGFISRTEPHLGDRPLIVCGELGEIFRSQISPYRPFQQLLGPKPFDIEAELTDRYYTSLLDTLDHETETEVRYRISVLLAHIRHRSRNEQEVLDRFYAFQRFGQKNQKLGRDPWHANRVSPFYSRRSIRAIFPQPSLPNRIRETIVDPIATHLPGAVNFAFNGEAVPWIYGPGLVNAFALDTITLAHKVNRRFGWGLRRADGDLQAIRDRIAMELLDPVLRDPASQIIVSGRDSESGSYSISDVFRTNGRNVWMHLVALRFLRICEEMSAKHAVFMAPETN